MDLLFNTPELISEGNAKGVPLGESCAPSNKCDKIQLLQISIPLEVLLPMILTAEI